MIPSLSEVKQLVDQLASKIQAPEFLALPFTQKNLCQKENADVSPVVVIKLLY